MASVTAGIAALHTTHTLSRSAAKLQTRLRNQLGRAVCDYSMLKHGDRVMVCVSGGKDSFAMLDLLLALQRNAPIQFQIHAVNLDQKQPGFPADVLPRYMRERDIPFSVIEQDTYSVVQRVIPQGKTTCGLCSRLRRGALYRYAQDHGFTKIALGHHRDDILETFFLNLFHGGRIKAMPPKLLSENGRHIVIRPLAYCRERDIARYARARDYPIIACNLCGSQDNLQRSAIKAMLAQWEQSSPGRSDVMFRALKNVSPSQLADPNLFDFDSMVANSERGDELSSSSPISPTHVFKSE